MIVDLAAEKGGNCEVTKPGEVIEHHGVTVVGYTDLASRMAHVASELYGTNLLHFLDEMGGASAFKVDHANDAVRPALVLEQGEKRWPPPVIKKPEAPKLDAPKVAPAHTPVAPVAKPGRSHGPAQRPPSRRAGIAMSVVGMVAAIAFVILRFARPDQATGQDSYALLQHLTVFVMAIFVGMQVVWNVTPALHTPLMSVTNAISGIIVLGGLLNARGSGLPNAVIVAIVATLFATINISGGFLVTRRMLAMFRK